MFHAGEQVGTRKRYSDPLLMFGIREMRERRRGSQEGAAAPPMIARTPRVTVVIAPFDEPENEEKKSDE